MRTQRFEQLPPSLARLAEVCGIETSFIDSAGQRRCARQETTRSLLAAWGLDASTDKAADACFARVRDEKRSRSVEPVIVAWNGKLRLPRNVKSHIRVEPIEQLNEGAVATRESKPSASLAPGYYRLITEDRSGTSEALVISAPIRAYERSNFHTWGLFLPMYAAHSEASWGAGNLTDWENFAAATADAGGTVVATLPLMAAFLDRWKSEPSPYSPASRLFWNEFFLDVERVPEFRACSAAQELAHSARFLKEVSALRRLPNVDYEREMRLKRSVLELCLKYLLRSGDAERHRSFERLVADNKALREYAAFRATCERRGQPWSAWPGRLRNGELRSGDYSEQAARYHMYVQCLAQEQMGQVLSSCRSRGVSFYLDLPLGVNPDGFDVWRERDNFVLNASVGAPPDSFFTKGQDWGFPPLHPERIRRSGYQYVIEYLRFQMRHTGLLRLDHVMGLHRLWWVPHGASAAEGAYVRYKADELYAILCLESHRHQCMLVGENLGTVPPAVNLAMKRHGLRTMFVVQYEAQPNARQPLRSPPRECVASLNTHDMPMWAAHWSGADIVDRRSLGLLKASEVAEESQRRGKLRSALEHFLTREKLLGPKKTRAGRSAKEPERPDAEQIQKALLRFLARSKAEVVLVNAEDLWLETAPQNTPGTSIERVNWRRKTKRTWAELWPELRDFFEALNRAKPAKSEP